MKERILIVDDEESSRELCRMALEGSQREIILCSSAKKALEEIEKQPFDLVLTDMVMPGLNGIELLEKIKSLRSDISVILMSGKGSIASAVKAIRSGAEDFIEKPLPDPEVLSLAVKRILKSRKLERENRELRRELKQLQREPVLIGGKAFSAVLRTVEKVAPLDMTILITGETGTGKEVVARRIHAFSRRSRKPFIALNCGGIPQGLLESLLFGHEKGAFTGAVKRNTGYFEEGNGGIVFLDEIGDMPLDLQIKLLRVLQDQTFRRVGGDIDIAVDCRIIAATHRNLKEMVSEGSFREDLFYRLNVIEIPLPPLRERIEDIPALTHHFLRIISARMKKPITEITREAVEYLQSYHWPGNIRELQNTLERAAALCSGNTISIDDLPAIIPGEKDRSEVRQTENYQDAKIEFERQFLLAVLENHDHNISAAARACGIPRQNFYLKMKKLGIELQRA